MNRARRSPFAGVWYPGDPDELRKMVEELLAVDAESEMEGEPLGLVCPHAGLMYSGPVAGPAYRSLVGSDFETVILLGPSHQVFFDALAVYPDGAFETPLGPVAIDAPLAHALVEAAPEIEAMPEVHDREHCLEMQLPFLQVVLPDARIVPVMMGNQSPALVETATNAILDSLARVERRALLIASSDLSHYEPRERARALDRQVVDCLERFDDGGLAHLLAVNHYHACGGGPIVSVMRASKGLGATLSKVVKYGDSGDTSGETQAVVGYVSAAFSS
jgi:AmmeMemoRadiSam system protein B